MNMVALTNAVKTKTRANQRTEGGKARILLIKPPYFSPWTPPLGIAILKSYLEQDGYSVTCHDFNTDPKLWGMHHKYFNVLQSLEDVSINDGYSKLWWVLNAHMLAYANEGEQSRCAKVVESITPLYGITTNREVIRELVPLVEDFYARLKELIDQMDLSSYSVVGTSTYTTSLGPSLFSLKYIKQKYPGIKTVMGGGVFADDLASGSENLETLVRECDFVDHVVLGEGELLFLRLLEGEFAHKRVISIADLNGRTLEMKDVPIPNFSDVGTENYFHLSIEGARSCPFQCSFCSETIQWGDYRKKTAESFADQVIELARTYNNKSFFMGDSLMNPYINPFATELIRRKANILYDGYLRADRPVANREFVKLWTDSGCYRVRLGIESASARVLDSMQKMTTPRVISDVLKTLANAGVRTTTYWIVGFPGETEADFQETCEFIREHHRFIYELEAHPYYYYPYGQIGSRLHQCYSLYPDEVTAVIKFKTWEIIDSEPMREERYDRLRRISKLASDLKLPNIYTMGERFAAEQRWLRLHPLAADVYECMQTNKSLPDPTDDPMDVFCDEWRKPALVEMPDRNHTLIHHVHVKKSLDAQQLIESIAHLVRWNEMLRVKLIDGKYVAMQVDSLETSRQIMSVHSAAGDAAEGNRSSPEIVRELATELKPEPGDSIRVAVVSNDDKASDLFVLAHRAIADAKSLTLMMENLFRVYEQLRNNREPVSYPVEKTYRGFVSERNARIVVEQANLHIAERMLPDSHTNRNEVCSIVVPLNDKLSNRLFSESSSTSELLSEEAIVIASLRSLERGSGGGETRIDVLIDHRLRYPDLADTQGVLTRLHPLPQFSTQDEALHLTVARVKAAIAGFWNTDAVPEAIDDRAGLRVLINLEYFHEHPWLGGDLWVPQGFLGYETGPREGYDLEIAPAARGDHAELCLKYIYTENMRPVVDRLARALAPEIETIVDYLELRAEAKQFWVEEFRKEPPKSNIELAIDVHSNSGDTWSFASWPFPSLSISAVQARCGLNPSSLLLSVFSLLLSRLSGQEDVVIVASIEEDRAGHFVPVRLKADWELGFAQYARHVYKKISRSHEHGELALDVLSSEIFGVGDIRRSLVFDVGFLFNTDRTSTCSRLEHLCQSYPDLTSHLTLAFEATQTDGTYDARLVYRPNCLTSQTIEEMLHCLDCIIREIEANPDVRLGDIDLGQKRKSFVATSLLASGSFNFS